MSTPPIGSALEAAASAIQRWITRPDTQQRLFGGNVDPLPSTERWLLAKIAGAGPVRMSTLAEWQHVDRSTVTTQVRRLEDLGYVLRHPDPSDGRASLVSLSDTGRERHDHVRAIAAEAFEELIADWPPSERTELARLLTKFAAALDEPHP